MAKGKNKKGGSYDLHDFRCVAKLLCLCWHAIGYAVAASRDTYGGASISLVYFVIWFTSIY